MIGLPTTPQTVNTGSTIAPLAMVAPAKHHGHITVWIVPFRVLQTQCSQLHHLSADEQERAFRKRTPSGTRRFILARTFLRSVLAAQMNCSPGDVKLHYSNNGKPMVAHGPAFNLSHCDQVLVVAIADNDFTGQIGVDVEAQAKQTDRLRLASRCFSIREQKQLATYPTGTSRLNAFTRAWTRKEAVVKAKGTGLGTPLTDFDVSLKPKGTSELEVARTKPRSLLLSSKLDGVLVSYCDLYDIGTRSGCETGFESAVAIIRNSSTDTTSVSVHEISEQQLNGYSELSHG